MKKKNLAIIGGGAAGMVAAWLLRNTHNVTLFEANNYIGGHVHTQRVDIGNGMSVPIDMGVEYFNERISPNVFNILQRLGLGSYVAPSSFHAYFPSEEQYWSNVTLEGPLRQAIQEECSRFQLGMSEVMSSGDPRYKAMTIAEYLTEKGYSETFIHQALYPMMSISTGCNVDLRVYPLMFFAISFNANLVSFFSPGYWRKVRGGMQRYLQVLAETLGDHIKLNTAVKSVKPYRGKVQVCYGDRDASFDAVIFATSAEVTLSLLAEPTHQQQEILSQFEYHNITSVAHHDADYLNSDIPLHYFNFRQFTGTQAHHTHLFGSVTRVNNALMAYQNITTPLLVTLDPTHPIRAEKIVKTCHWRAAKQRPADFMHKMRLRELQGKDNLWFCGVDTSLAGHEGAVVSGMVIADRLGAPYPYKDDTLAFIQFRITKDIMGVKTRHEAFSDALSGLMFVFAKKLALHKTLSYKFVKDFIM
ncbi:FAD-dependent oxidoreductase [Pectobacterium actinidiae]|uniref:FAD-dependent oxidoreductase n=1 Tax=Pectobacterium actinidiae TaxID=1507808 RepID=A0ABW8G8Z0_9GAMM